MKKKGMRLRDERGIYISLSTFLCLMIIMLTAIILSTGLLSSENTRLQNIANLAALAALEEFSKDTDPLAYTSRVDAARERVNQILSVNQLKGTEHEHRLGEVAVSNAGSGGESNAGGILTMGRWCVGPDGTQECKDTGNRKYPDFVMMPTAHGQTYSDPDDVPKANAVKLMIRNQQGEGAQDNPIRVPLGSFLGRKKDYIDATTVATLAPRCIAFATDTSPSVVEDSYREPSISAIEGCYRANPGDACTPIDHCATTGFPLPDPASPGKFAYSKKDNGSPGYPAFACPDLNNWCGTGGYPGGRALGIWESADHFRWCCDLTRCRGTRALNTNTTPNFRSDYRLIESGFGDVWVDTVGAAGQGPEPLTTYMKAFNAGMVKMNQLSVGADQAMIFGFNKGIESSTALTTDIGLLLQLSNTDNIGLRSPTGDVVTPEIHPNFIDMGWFPRDGNSGTNVQEALTSAYNALTEGCPENARKMIVLATDGLINCVPDGGGTECGDTGESYKTAEDLILDNDFVKLLTDAQVSITVLMSGGSVGPHILNIENPSPRGEGTRYLDQYQARAMGYGGIGSPPNKRFFYFEEDHEIDDIYQKMLKGEEQFFRPNALMGELAFVTGGIWCPLMEPGTSDKYVGGQKGAKIKDDERGGPNARLLWAEYNLTKTEQAIKCVQDLIGATPFMLVHDPKDDEN